MTVWMCARGRAHCMCSLGLAGVSEGVVCFPSRRIFFFFFYVMLDEHYAATLGGRNPFPASACNAAHRAWGGPSSQHCSARQCRHPGFTEKRTLTIKPLRTDSTLLPCSRSKNYYNSVLNP